MLDILSYLLSGIILVVLIPALIGVIFENLRTYLHTGGLFRMWLNGMFMLLIIAFVFFLDILFTDMINTIINVFN